MPPPPGLPLHPLHRLARALTCEIKRDFNYLSAKQQLERITAQQRSPPPLSPPGLPSPLFLQPPPSSEGVLQFSSGSLCPREGETKDVRWSVLGRRGRKDLQGRPTGGCGLLVTPVSLCVCTLEMASSHLTGIRACPGLRPSRVSAWLARAHTRVCMQACQQPGGSAALR